MKASHDVERIIYRLRLSSVMVRVLRRMGITVSSVLFEVFTAVVLAVTDL